MVPESLPTITEMRMSHDDTREVVTLVLSEHNYRVTTGATIVDALKLSREHHFDLYMLNSWLPDGSGIQPCKNLRDFDPSIPIMFRSAAAYETDKATAIISGAQGDLIKPVDLDVLCNEVSKFIGKFPRKRELVDVPAMHSSNLRGSSEDSAGLERAQPFNTTLKR